MCAYYHLTLRNNTCMCVQAVPESLFEATLAEGIPFKVKAAVTDPSGFHADGEPLELEFRYNT